MSFSRSVLRRWFRFDGTLPRGDYNSINLVALMLMLAANMTFVAPLFLSPPDGYVTFADIPLGLNAVAAGLLFVAAMWIAVSSAMRRLRDLGYSVWWMALVLIPVRDVAIVVSAIGLVLLCLVRGRQGAEMPEAEPNALV